MIMVKVIVSYQLSGYSFKDSFFSLPLQQYLIDILQLVMKNTPTPHIGAENGDIAPIVLMAGDPLRAKFIAENYLENPVQFNDIRGMLGFTGTYKDRPVSVMGHGMGIPSIGIYTWELFNFFGVETIIRIGSAGAYDADLKLGDLVLAQAACTDSNYGAQFELPGTFAPIADFDLLRRAADACEQLGYHYKVGNVLSSDAFYCQHSKESNWQKMGVLAVEMEASALYLNAAFAHKKALTICTISDIVLTGEGLSAEARRTSFTHMMEVAFSLV
jgi:purine-nucleoside phosphorylase